MTGITYNEATITGSGGRAEYFSAMKENYYPKLNDWVQSAEADPITPLVMRKKGKMVQGQKIVALAVTGDPQSIQYAGEGSAIPVHSGSTFATPTAISRTMVYRLSWSEEVQESAKGGASSWIGPKTQDMEGARREMASRISRNIHRGRHDVIGRVLLLEGNVITLENEDSRLGDSSAFFNSGRLELRVGMDIQFIDAAATRGFGDRPAYDQANGTALRLRVTAVGGTTATPTVTVDQTQLTATGFEPAVGDWIIGYDSRAYSGSAYADTAADSISNIYAMSGLVDFLVDSTVTDYAMGLTKSTTPGMQPKYRNGGGSQRAFTELLVHDILREGVMTTSELCNELVLSPVTYTEVMKENRDNRLFDPVQGESGARNMAYTDFGTTLKYKHGFKCLPGLIWAFDKKHFEYYEQKPLSAPPGYEGEKRVAGYRMSEVVASKMGNIVNVRPEAGGCIDNITVSRQTV